MSPSNHFVASWLVGALTTNNSRDRKLVTLAGLLPDLDGLGIIVDMISEKLPGRHFELYQRYHHYVSHGWPGALVICGALTLFAKDRWRTFGWCLVTFHLHLLCDFVGSRGETAQDLWPIAYGEPLFRNPVFVWTSQWPLDGWQNMVFFSVVLFLSLLVARKKGVSFLEFFGRAVDSRFVKWLRVGTRYHVDETV